MSWPRSSRSGSAKRSTRRCSSSGAAGLAHDARSEQTEATPDRRAERAEAGGPRDRRGFAIAAISTVVVIGGLAALILTSSGWPEVRETFFNGEIFRDSFPEILEAFWFNVRMFIVVEVVVLAIGLMSR